jgi:xanthine dehydrogenase FAD-binding subunit
MSHTYPSDLEEALAIRATGARPYAGGTDFMVRHKDGLGRGEKFDLLFLPGVTELFGIALLPGELRIGPMTTMADLASSPLIPDVVRLACAGVGSPALRNLATIGGNLCTASPAGDGICALHACRAEVELRSVRTTRRLLLEEFVLGPDRTAMTRDELLTAILIPHPGPDVSFFRKVGSRPINVIAKVSLAFGLWTRDSYIVRARMALGAVGPTVIRCNELEDLLVGRTREQAVSSAAELAVLAGQAARPIDDLRSTAEYRRAVVENLAADALHHELSQSLF